MRQVVVPQFIDAEDKIIGPVTVRQFIEIIVGVLLCFIYFRLFDFSLFLVLTFLTGSFTLILAFVKVRGQLFHDFILNFISTLKSPKLKVWHKAYSRRDLPKEERQPEEKSKARAMTKPPLKYSSLSQLSLIIDTGGMYQGEDVLAQKNNLK